MYTLHQLFSLNVCYKIVQCSMLLAFLIKLFYVFHVGAFIADCTQWVFLIVKDRMVTFANIHFI